MTAPKPPRDRALCAPCFANWLRVLEPGRQQPQMFRIIHIGGVTGAELQAAALKRADEHWARVRAYQDNLVARCLAEAERRRDEALNALGDAEQRAENAEDRLSKASNAYALLSDRADDAEEARERWRHRAEEAEAAVARVRRLCDLTIAASCRVQAIDQARDTLRVLDQPKETDG